MRIVANKLKDVPIAYSNGNVVAEFDTKIDGLIALIDKNKTVKNEQINAESKPDMNKAYPANIKAFKDIDVKNNISRTELLDEFSELLMSNKFDSRSVKKFVIGELIIKITMILFGIVMITLGFAMIIMPAPPYFEMFTIYYFSLDDGITLMDLISLVIVLAGVYVLVRALYKQTTTSR